MRGLALFALIAVSALCADHDGYHQRRAARFLAEAETEPGVHKLASGMLFKVLAKGTGEKSPTENDDCDVHYVGSLRDGTKFDSSYKRTAPSSFKPTQVIKGWREALQLMREGDKWEVYIPFDLAYGARGNPPKVPPFATLIFQLHLIKVKGKGKPASEADAEIFKQIGKPYAEL